MAPTVTSSPSRAPARARARSTPRRRSRRTASACAPSSLRSDSATARSAARPATTQAPAPVRCTSTPSGAGRCTTTSPATAPDASARASCTRGPAARPASRHRRRLRPRAPGRRPLLVRRDIGLATHDDTGAFEELGPVGGELGQQDAQLRVRRLPAQVGRAEIEQHDEDPGALDVAEELVAQALAFRGALDEAGDVGHDELGAVAPGTQPDHSEMRLQRGERVVRDLRLGGRHGRDQRRLPRVGEPDQRHVGHQLELHVQPELLALLALLGERRRPPAVGEEARVAPPALAPLGHHEAGALRCQVAHHGAARSRTTVPTGTGTTRSLPRAPCRLDPEPCAPSVARRNG